ncbi:Hypothetical predicted protein [Pelobates cultripes]|uniref:Uncharacterized protein n=1 Tax=Pelobates cultripes TaxID=61616 RepID=A0AAD1VN36_PELCU|nr:Hypothetical predicted protein [Pelobates cultripes]
MEFKMDDFASAHNDLASHVEQLEQKLDATETKLEGLEDRSRPNNLRLRGIPEIVLPADLQAYGLLHAYAPEILADMLLVDQVHWIPHPWFLPNTAPRASKSSRNKPKSPENYLTVKIFADPKLLTHFG